MIGNRFKNEKKSVEQLIREYRRDMRKCDKYQLPQPTTHYVRILLRRVEAACRRAYNEIDDAVCAKLRNCDVGTAEEQYRAHGKFCDAIRHGISGYHCDDAPHCVLCFSKWAQMPYKEGGAK